MIYGLSGKVVGVGLDQVILKVSGVSYRVFVSKRTAAGILPDLNTDRDFFCFLRLRDDGMDLFGFLRESDLKFYELLNSVSGVGPKLALAIMDIAETEDIISAIKEGRPDLLAKTSGVGEKTAQRIVLELKNKVQISGSGESVKRMEDDRDIVETLINLGFRKEEIKTALQKIQDKGLNMEERLKAALKILSGKK